MDHILIKDLVVRCIIGVGEGERREKQDVVINITLSVDLRKPGQTDRLEDSVDYRTLKKRIVGMVEESEYHLVEALAEWIAEICLENSRVAEAQVTVEKPTALRFARSVGVEVFRCQPEKANRDLRSEE